MLKIAVLGAGSVGFTRNMVRDILCVPEFQGIMIALHDINERNLNMVQQLIERDIRESKLPTKVEAHLDRKKALEGAKYIFSFVRVGGLEAFQHDVDIPLRYGVDQCVGDTLGPGGIMYAQRGIPVLLDFCADIEAVAHDDALFLNYSNPMAMLTWACSEYSNVPTIGLCHGVMGGHSQLASVIELLARENGWIKPEETVSRKDVDIICAGINHQTWYVQVRFQGDDMTPYLLEGFEKHPTYSKTEKVRIDMLRRFGFYSTESNGHLSEYVPWYRKRPREIPEWVDMSSWINGETGGYLRVCTEGRNWFEHEFPQWMTDKPYTFRPEDRGNEHGSYILEGLETGRLYRGHFNLQNNGIISNLPDDCIIEAPGYVDGNGISMPLVGELPLGCAAVCNASVSVQRIAVEAAMSGDTELLKQAMMMDPLTGAVCNPKEIWQMADHMLVELAEWLPQYEEEIPTIHKRLEFEPSLARFEGNTGAARLHTRTVEEMSADESAKKAAKESDKAGMSQKG
jgi:alpha-galactosidase